MHRCSADVVGDPTATPTQDKPDRDPIWAKTQHTCSTHPCWTVPISMTVSRGKLS